MTTVGRRWLIAEEVATITGLHIQTVYSMARTGRIPAIRVGKSIRFDRAEFDQWMATRPRANT